MGRYKYRGRYEDGELVEGHTHAYSLEDARKSLRNSGIRLTLVEEVVGETPTGNPLIRINGQPLAVIFRQAATLHKAGITLDRAFGLLAQQVDTSQEREMLQGVETALLRGLTLTQALSLYPGTFEAPHVAMIKLGEFGGILTQVLETLAKLTEQSDLLRRQVRAALTYPFFVLIAALVILMGLVSFVLPPFFELVHELKVELPIFTRALVFVAGFIRQVWFFPALIGLGVVLWQVWKRVRYHDEVRRFIDSFSINNLFFGKIGHKIALSRALQLLAALGKAGVPLSVALPMAAEACSNSILEDGLKTVAVELEHGASMSAALKGDVKLFTRPLIAYVEVGELSGELPEMLVSAADTFTLDTMYALEVLPELLEPIVIMILGVLCGAILIAVLSPLYTALKGI